MKNKSLAELTDSILKIRTRTDGTIPLPLTYKSGQNTGAMIALFLPATYARKYALTLPGALDPSEMHITLAYLGKADQLSGYQVDKVHEFIELVSEHHPPLTGTINGCGRFCNGDDEGDPFFIIPDLPDLPNLRELIVLWLKGNDVPVAQDHGYTPHITLAYIPHTEPNPFDDLERSPVNFPTISLVLAGDRYDYPLNGGMETKALIMKSVLVTKIGARHTKSECERIQKMHDLARKLGAECHRMTQRAGAKHSRRDQETLQRIHDDCVTLGAECPKRSPVNDLYGSQVLKEGEIIKAQSDAPNYAPASTPQRCANCRFFLGDPGRDFCELYDFTADQDYTCDSWEAQRPDEIPGYVANKADLAALTKGILILRGGSRSVRG